MLRRDDIVGSWQLVSCQGHSEDGAASFLPYGTRPSGKLMYALDGQMMVLLMNSERTPFVSADISKASSDEIVDAFTSFDAYCGRWLLDECTGAIEHIIEAGRIPNWVGNSHIRYAALDDNTLTLITEPFSMAGKTWRVKVHWKRPVAA
jgi:hypothetical protein